MSCCDECTMKEHDKVIQAIKKIDACIQKLDLGSLKSEKVRNVLLGLNGYKTYEINPDRQHPVQG